MADMHLYEMPDNYIYLYHAPNANGGTGVYILLPTYSDNIADTMSVNFQSSNPLSRSAPIYSFVNAGPRSINFNFELHRDMMQQLNYTVSNAPVKLEQNKQNDEDYIDIIANYIRAAALPAYSESQKMVNPPMVAVRMGNEIFIKGVVGGSVTITYGYPILRTNKYARVNIQFSVNEVDPYDAVTAMRVGGYRGISTTLERSLWVSKTAGVSK